MMNGEKYAEVLKECYVPSLKKFNRKQGGEYILQEDNARFHLSGPPREMKEKLKIDRMP